MNDEHSPAEVFTPEKLMYLAGEGKMLKSFLAEQLIPKKRKQFLDTCASFEKALTEICKRKGDSCLEGGCAMSDEEACLNAILRAGELYTLGYVALWVYLFVDPANRVNDWKK